MAAATDRAPLSEYVARRDNGSVGSGASVRILLPGTGSTTTVYSAQTGTGTLTQPLTADSRGRLPGWVVPRSDGYDSEITIDGTTLPVQRIRPATPSAVSSALLIPSVAVTRTAAQSIATGTEVAIQFTTETGGWDTDAMHDNATNNTRLTATLDGVYLITGSLAWASDATGNRRISIRKNGSTFLARDRATPISGGETEQNISVQRKLVAGDYVELTAIQTTAGALNVVLSGDYSPRFEMTWIASG